MRDMDDLLNSYFALAFSEGKVNGKLPSNDETGSRDLGKSKCFGPSSEREGKNHKIHSHGNNI